MILEAVPVLPPKHRNGHHTIKRSRTGAPFGALRLPPDCSPFAAASGAPRAGLWPSGGPAWRARAVLPSCLLILQLSVRSA
jgi:hypothetical protein